MLMVCALCASRAAAVLLPNWGLEPVETQSATRACICLNGLWKFMPASGTAGSTPDNDWGWLRVPGSWCGSGWPPVLQTVVQPGIGPLWQDFRGAQRAWGQQTVRVWFERSIRIPAAWAGRAILLECARVGTDAKVFVNDRECGSIAWPRGTVDITRYVTPGATATLRLLVAAVPEQGDVTVYMGTAVEQVSTTKAEVRARGLIGDVLLLARPRGAHVSDVFVQPSVRRKSLTLTIEFADVTQAGAVQVQPRAYHPDGTLAREFPPVQVLLSNTPLQDVTFSWPWLAPRLWEYRDPYIYTLQLAVRGAPLDDEYAQLFGFREVWLEGKHFFLNGTEFRWRPILGDDCLGTRVRIAEMIDDFITAGFNIMELWPNDTSLRGEQEYQEQALAVADAKGWPVMARAKNLNRWMGAAWDDPHTKARWQREMQAELRRVRNHPSVFVWASSGNFFGDAQDQNPVVVGRTNWVEDAEWNRRARQGLEGLAMIKAFDPTRPVFTHQGAYVGDVHTCNNYLNMIPLQEREEWLSAWRTNGAMPFCGIEFGVPMNLSLHRGRNGHHVADSSECLMSEFCAIYFGERAYQLEPAVYRQGIRDAFEGGQNYGFHRLMIHGMEPFDSLVDLFQCNTWRSWRTMGTTAGMIPWAHAYREPVRGSERVEPVAFTPGTRGTFLPERTEQAYAITRRGASLQRVNRDTLAWLAGSAACFAEKDHHYFSGAAIEKQVVIINDSRMTLPFSAEYTVTLGGQTIASDSVRGRAEPCRHVLLPLSVTAPMVAGVTTGAIALHATIGTNTHRDVFALRVYPPPPAFNVTVPRLLLFDPVGATRALLTNYGVPFVEVTAADVAARAAQASRDVLVIGRRALDAATIALPAIEPLVANGGRVLMFAQSPAWFRRALDLRVAQHVARRCWPVSTETNHALLASLDGDDFRDWRGCGSLVDAYPDYFNTPEPPWPGKPVTPAYGWHWGNRGSVASAMIETPHHAGWTPLLHGEFDLAFSPLLELQYGSGLWLLCTLDLEGRTDLEPVADLMTRRLLAYISTTPVTPRARPTLYVGAPEGERLLQQMGLEYQRVTAAPQQPALLIVGMGAALSEADITRFLERGGNVFYLARAGGLMPFGLRTERRTMNGSLYPPAWPETRGLSASDLRVRVDVPATILAGGNNVDIGANGLLARAQRGAGVAVLMQVNPLFLDAGKETYLRYSQWRATRAVAQVLANLGATFRADRKAFDWTGTRASLPIAGMWKCAVEVRMPSATDPYKPHKDAGNKGEAMGWAAPQCDDRAWTDVRVPGLLEEQAGEFDGAGWFRKTITMPHAAVGKELVLSLGPVDDCDTTFFNGQQIGATGTETPGHWEKPRVYRVPLTLVKAGDNVIAVRLWDRYGTGGVIGPAAQMQVKTADGAWSASLAGEWLFRVESTLPAAASIEHAHHDPGIAPAARGWAAPALATADWKPMSLPVEWEKGLFAHDGAVWFRRAVVVPAALTGQVLNVHLGKIDDLDTTYINGTRIGATTSAAADGPAVCEYAVPPGLLHAGTNLLAVRVFDQQGTCGFLSDAQELRVYAPHSPAAASFYYPGYRTDFAYGDDPYRYYRW
jgi:beta-galactosidase